MPSRQTDLPLVGVQIPTASFFWIAPVLGAALYIYMHLFLIKLWDAHVPPTSDTDGTHHWLVNDFVLIRQRDRVTTGRPFTVLSNRVTRLLVWDAALVVLAFAWWRSMPAHNELLTLTIAFCLWICIIVGFGSWTHLEENLNRIPPGHWSIGCQIPLALLIGYALITVSWIRTEGGFHYKIEQIIDIYERTTGNSYLNITIDENDDVKPYEEIQVEWIENTFPSITNLLLTYKTPLIGRWIEVDYPWSLLARADLTSGELVSLPPTWRTPETARAAFRETWCKREGLEMGACGQPAASDAPTPDWVTADRRAWCLKHGNLPESACAARFSELDEKFSEAWKEERTSARDTVGQIDLAFRDLRNASASAASLIGADLRGARMEGANFSFARMEAADLWLARMEGARMEGADLRGARMEGADLSGARMEGANLSGARMERADLSGADVRSANWAGASNRASLAQFADLRGAQELMQAQLDELVGNGQTLLPEGDAPDTGEPYYIWSCWETPPEGFDALVERLSEFPLARPEEVRAEFLCGPTNPREKLYNGLSLDAPYPPGHPLAELGN